MVGEPVLIMQITNALAQVTKEVKELMIPEAIWLALIVAIPATLTPPIAAWWTNRTRRQEKEEDWARQDKVAERLLEEGKKNAQSVAKVAEVAAETAKVTDKKLDQIHTVVNSQFTAIKKALLRATERELVLLTHIAGKRPTKDQAAEIEATQKQIKELRLEIEVRVEAQ